MGSLGSWVLPDPEMLPIWCEDLGGLHAKTQLLDGGIHAIGTGSVRTDHAGYFLVLEKGDTQVTVTVLDETKTVDGVECRVVEEKEVKGGKVIEKARNYFAISKRTNSVFYFGEDVGGAWLSGEKGARFGLMMPGTMLLKAKFYQEIAPGVAMDRAEVVSVTETVKTPAGTFKNCVKMEETTPLEPNVKEYKYYAAGIGLVQEGDLVLVKHGYAKKAK
jgi:hypothetical protein